MKYTITTFIAACLLVSVACMNINSPNGPSVTELRADERGFVAGLGIESEVAAIGFDQSARGRGLMEDPQLQAKVDNLHEGKTFNLHVGKLGLRYIMVVSTIMFCLFIVTYSDRMVYPDWQRMPEPTLLWINTFILFISSFVFVRIQLASEISPILTFSTIVCFFCFPKKLPHF